MEKEQAQESTQQNKKEDSVTAVSSALSDVQKKRARTLAAKASAAAKERNAKKVRTLKLE